MRKTLAIYFSAKNVHKINAVCLVLNLQKLLQHLWQLEGKEGTCYNPLIFWRVFAMYV